MLGLLCLPACRKHDPPTLVAKDVGTDQPLLPTAAPVYDEAAIRGKATPIPAEDVLDADTTDEESGEGEGEDAGLIELTDEDRELIQGLIEDTAYSLADQDFAALGELLPPAQREPLAPVFAQIGKLAEAGQGLGEIMQEKMPGGAAMPLAIPGLPPGALGAPGQEPDPEQILAMVQLSDLEIAGPNRAAGKLTMMGQSVPLKFLLVEDEWFFDLPDVFADAEVVDGMVEAGEVIETKLSDLTARLEDGSLGPEALMPELMAMGQSLQQEIGPIVMRLAPKFEAAFGDLGSAAARPDADRPDDEEEPDDADTDGAEEDGAVDAGLDVPGDLQATFETLLASLDDAENERRWADVGQFYAPDQREAAERLGEVFGALFTGMDEFADGVDPAMPGAGNQIHQRVTILLGLRRTITELDVASEDRYEATITEGGSPSPYELRRVDGQWLLWDPDLANEAYVEGSIRIVNAAVERLNTVTDQVSDEELSGGRAMTQYRQIMQDLSAQLNALRTGEDPDASPPPSPRRRRDIG